MKQGAATLQKTDVQRLRTTNFFISIVIGDNKSINTGGGSFAANAPVTTGDQNEITATTTIALANPINQELDRLTKLVEELTRHLPALQAQNAKDDMESLKREVARSQPRRSWYELSAEGLKDAAKAVTSIGPDVVKSVETVLKLLTSN